MVETKQRLLYFTLPGGKAMRYGVALGRDGYGWTGEAVVDHKAEWPDWNPPADMIARWPQVRKTKGGWTNPLGARALYLFQNGNDNISVERVLTIHLAQSFHTLLQWLFSFFLRLRVKYPH